MSTISKEQKISGKFDPSTFETTSRRQRSQIKIETINKRDTKPIKILISISLLFIFTFVPKVLFLLGKVYSFGIVYAYFTNHFGNPILYYTIDKRFRNQLKKDVETICNFLSKT